MRKMKDSGIEWIGEIPEGWDACTLRRVILVLTDYTANGSFSDLAKNVQYLDNVDYARLIRLTDLRVNLENKGVYVSKDSYEYLKKSALYGGEILMANVGAYAGYCCEMPKVSYRTTLAPNMFLIKFNNDYLLSQYSLYLLNSDNIQKQLIIQSENTAAQPKLNKSNVRSIFIPLPSLPEQQRIADYLDAKCGEIDSAIEKLMQIIEKLQEYKRSLITQVVTKGLNPKVKMKESGIDWIGEIPEGWSVGKTLHALAMSITDGPHETPELFDEGIPFVSAEAVSCGNGKIDFSHIRGYISQDFYHECCKKYIPQINDIYLIKSGATTGKVALVDTDICFTIWSPLAVFRCNSEVYNFKYLFYFLQSDDYQKQIENNWSWGTQQNIGMRVLEKLLVCFPPLPEQQQIADYLDDKCSKIDAVIAKKQTLIEKLTEYKKSLIYEVVTGKREI